jgi:DNA-binding SARP family transcriptional activator
MPEPCRDHERGGRNDPVRQVLGHRPRGRATGLSRDGRTAGAAGIVTDPAAASAAGWGASAWFNAGPLSGNPGPSLQPPEHPTASASTAHAPARPTVAFCVLGPLEFWLSGRPVPLTQRVQRIVLATLVLSANQVVSVWSLIEAIWQDADSKRINNLHYHISRLRSLLREREPGRDVPRIITSPPGYQFVANKGERDIDAFAELAGAGREAAAAGRHGDAAILYRQALSLRRGPALGDVRDANVWLGAEAERLDEMALSVLEDRLEADIACKRHHEVVSDLTILAVRYPCRERVRCLLILALYRCGRQVDALEVYGNYAATLREELGLDPGPAMQRLRQRILTQELEVS